MVQPPQQKSSKFPVFRDIGSTTSSTRSIRAADVVMPDPQVAPFGSWASPITSDMIVASSIGLGEILIDGADVYWLESRPQEGGRSVVVRRAPDGTTVDVTPPAAADGKTIFSVRTRVHEYGGGAYLVSAGVV